MHSEEIEMLFVEAEYDLLIEKVLMRCGVFASHGDYEDYRQELRLLLVEELAQATSRQEFLARYYGSRLFGRLVWQMKDIFRKQRRRNEGCGFEEDLLLQLADGRPDPLQQVEEAQRTRDFWELLAEAEREKLSQLLTDRRENQLDRRRRYKFRKALEKKVKLF